MLVLPTEIRWSDLKRKDLEESIYWLADALGGKDLEWRLGGSGDGAPDGGRDLEAHFFQSEPDGDLVRQKWWIETKGRKKTVEIGAVRDAVLNAAGNADVDVLVVATNTTFSNPTRDWVKQWQKDHRRPRVRLWDRHDLEKLFSEHPAVVARLFPKALSTEGKLEVVRSRFWNYTTYTNGTLLQQLWAIRDQIEWSAQTRMAVVASEFANGDINKRSWAMTFDDNELVGVLAVGLLNFPYFLSRSHDSGVEFTPYLRSLAYLILVLLFRDSARDVYAILHNIWSTVEDCEPFPEQLRKIILDPVIHQVCLEIRDVCTDKCYRVDTKKLTLGQEEAEHYWDRFALRADETSDEDARQRFLTMEIFSSACRAGFELDRERTCPLLLLEDEESRDDLPATLTTVERAMKQRMAMRDLSLQDLNGSG